MAGDKHFIYSVETLVQTIHALETLGKHYLISTLDKGKMFDFKPRWIVEEVASGNPLEYEDTPPQGAEK